MINTDFSSASTSYGVDSVAQNMSSVSGSPGSLQYMFSSLFDPSGTSAAENRYLSALDREFNAEQALKQREFESFEAQKNRDFQERMSNSSYQRAVNDMKRAGLNPILAFQQGGASVPSGSSASGVSSSGSSGSPSISSKSALGGIATILNILAGFLK